MYMCIYIHIKQKFCTLIPGFSRFRESKLCWNGLSKMDLFFSFPDFKENEQALWCRMWTIFLFFLLPILAYGGHKLTRILLCTAFVNFCFPSKFCHLRCFVGKADVLCWLFFCCDGKKNVNMELHMLEMVIFPCWVVCASRCWTGITRSLPQSVQGNKELHLR